MPSEQSAIPYGYVRIQLTTESAEWLCNEMGRRPHDEAESREVWNALRVELGDSRSLSQTVILVKYQNVLGNRVPLGQTATYKLPDDAQEAEAWRRLKREHPDENPMEWRRKV